MIIVERRRDDYTWEPALTSPTGKPDASVSTVATVGEAIDVMTELESLGAEPKRLRMRDL